MARLVSFVTVTVLLAMVLPARAGDWPGWRGGDRQGRLEGTGYPTQWSATSNIAWKVEIPGAGHSSPVLHGGRVFVSTVYESTRGQHIRFAADLVVWLLMVGAVLRSVPLVAEAARPRAGRRSPGPPFLAATAFLVLWLFILVLAQFGPALFDYSRCPIRAWLASSFGFTLCAVASVFGLPGRSRRRLVIAGVCSLFAVLVIAGVPFKSHALRGLTFPPTNNSVVMLLAMGLPLAVGLRLALGWRAGGSTFWSGPMFKEGRWPSRRRLAAEALCLLPAVLGLAALVLRSRVLTTDPHADVPRAESALVPAWLAVVCAGFAGLVLAVMRRSGKRWRWAGPLLVLAAALAILTVATAVLERGVMRVPYLAYHWGKPVWAPVTGWTVAGLSVAVALAAFALAAFRPARGGELGIAACSTMALVAGAALFVRTNWLQGTRQDLRAIRCHDQASGRLVWKCEVPAVRAIQSDRRNTEATPTPVVAEGRVLAHFGGGELVCCGLDGKLTWVRRDLLFGGLYGAASSPVACEGIVVIQCDRSQHGAKVWALEIGTGKTRWCVELPDEKTPYGNHRTPVIVPWGNGHAVLVWRFNELAVLDLRTGGQLQRHVLEGSGDLVASAVADDQAIYLTQSEGTMAVGLQELADGRDPIRWRQKARGSNCPSPIRVGSSLLVVTDRGKVQYLDAKTGDPKWGASLRGLFWPSVVAGDDKAYFTNTDGVTMVLDACTGQPVATNSLQEEVYASMAGIDGTLYVRGVRNLFKIQSSPR